EELSDDQESRSRLLKYASNLYMRLNKFYDAVMTQSKIHESEKVKEHWYAIAQSLEDEKQFQFAEQVYSAIIDLLPGETQAYLGRCVANLVQNKSIKALEDLATAKKYAISVEDRIKIAMLYFQIGQAYQAKTILDEILQSSPENYEANLYKASLEQSEGNIDAANSILVKMVDLYPEDNKAIIQLANLMLANNNNDEAIEQYNKALQIDSNNAYIPYALSICYLNKGDKNKATEYLDQAIKLEPENNSLIDIKEKVLSIN
ncbi:MAG: tetratricopeptide repeat protein, partial [Candidatus Sericytochromatia bacterium]